MLGSYDLEEIHDWNQSIGKPMLWLYLVVSNVVLVNLLIAMMGYTFQEVKDQADREWKYGRVRSIIEVNERFCAIPPPINLPLTLYTFMEFWGRKIMTGKGEKSATKGMTEEEKATLKVELKEAKKLKGKVARKLLFTLKRKLEDEEDTMKSDLHASAQEQHQSIGILRELNRMGVEQGSLLKNLVGRVQTLEGKKGIKAEGPPSVRA